MCLWQWMLSVSSPSPLFCRICISRAIRHSSLWLKGLQQPQETSVSRTVVLNREQKANRLTVRSSVWCDRKRSRLSFKPEVIWEFVFGSIKWRGSTSHILSKLHEIKSLLIIEGLNATHSLLCLWYPEGKQTDAAGGPQPCLPLGTRALFSSWWLAHDVALYGFYTSACKENLQNVHICGVHFLEQWISCHISQAEEHPQPRL